MLVDDHAMVRAGYRLLLEADSGLRVVAEVENGEQAYRLYAEVQADVVIMDISMPGMGGLETIRRLISRYPDARILVASMHDSPVFAGHVLETGARGYLTKNSAPNDLVAAVRKVASGARYIEASIAGRLALTGHQAKLSPFTSLSSRELQILTFFAEGETVNEIAERLSLSTKTVSNYLTQLKDKLGVDSSAQLVRLAIQHSLVKL